MPLLRHVRQKRMRRTGAPSGSLVISSLRQILSTLAELNRFKHLARLLVAFILYNTGIGTVIFVAAVFGKEELVEAHIEIRGSHMHFAHRFAFVAGGPEVLGEGSDVRSQGAVIAPTTVVVDVLPGKTRVPRRSADRMRAETVVIPHAVIRQRIDVRRADVWPAVAGDVAVEIVDDHEEYVGTRSRLGE